MSRATPLRTWLLRAVLLAVVAGLVGLGLDVAWRTGRWEAALADVRFVEYPEKVTGAGAAVTVTGYVIATIASDVDFFALARAEGARPKVHAALCDSGRELRAWTDPLPQHVGGDGRAFRYAVLVPLRSGGVASPSVKVDLATGAEDVCIRFLAATMNDPLSWIPSRPVVVPMRWLRPQLQSYSQRDGEVRIVLDPGCAPQLCEPGFSMRNLQP